MKSFGYLLRLLIFFNLFHFQTAKAHSFGSVYGTVTDSVTGKPVAFVNIIIEKSLIGTTTDLKGEFSIINIEAGQHTLIFSHLGYKTRKITVTIKANEQKRVNIQLIPTAFDIEDLTVTAQRPFSFASSQNIRSADLALRPVKSSQDLLKLVPGLIIAQHAGGGKAEQIFLRGFDCDHGTDVHISVDGIPVNMVSHAHGQGYADLHFLIPELVDKLSVYKGPYFAQFGDFATAGAITFTTKDVLPDNSFSIEAGQFNTLKSTLLLQTGKGNATQNGIFAAQYFTTNGPFESPQHLNRMNVFGKYFVNITPQSRLSIMASSFNSAWNASGQIPERVIKSGIINRFGALDPMEGGTTSRQDISIGYRQKTVNHELKLRIYHTFYNFKLFSNFTYFLNDTIDGDMIEQLENRTMSGMNALYQTTKQISNKIVLIFFGTGFKHTVTEPQLWHSPKRIRKENLSNTDISETNLYFWAKSKITLNRHWHLEFGLREDYITYNVNDRLGPANQLLPDSLPHASGYAQQNMLNPKFNLVYSLSSQTDIYFNTGTGFHTNDARNVILTKKASEIAGNMLSNGYSEKEINAWLTQHHFDPGQRSTGTMPRAYGTELGVRTKIWNRLNAGFAVWYIYLEKEFVYAGDGGFSELSNPTRRAGIDIESRLDIARGFSADLDISISDGKITGNQAGENFIPLAPTFTLTGGFSLLDFHRLDATVRLRHVGSRPANEDNSITALGYTLLNMGLGYHFHSITFSLTMENLFNTQWNEAQFATETRMKWENQPVEELCFTPGNPFNIKAGIKVIF